MPVLTSPGPLHPYASRFDPLRTRYMKGALRAPQRMHSTANMSATLRFGGI